MSKCGKLLLIFGIIAFVSAVLFGISVAVFGVTDNNYNFSINGIKFGVLKLGGNNMGFFGGNSEILFRNDQTNIRYDFETNKEYSYTFSEADVEDISISLSSCHADIKCGDTGSIDIRYKTGSNKVSFKAEVSSNTLTIDEDQASWSLFGFGSSTHSELTVTIPKKMYDSVKYELASGKILSSDMTADSFKADVASGSMELGVFADKMSIHLASGNITVTNCTDNAASEISVETASGSCIMSGFRSGTTNVDLASGKVDLSGISGKVDADLASGHLNMSYAEWNDDLSVDLASGKADITLPAGSGANVSFKRISGSLSVDLDGKTARMDGNSNMTVGGNNVHNVNASTTSGGITIHN